MVHDAELFQTLLSRARIVLDSAVGGSLRALPARPRVSETTAGRGDSCRRQGSAKAGPGRVRTGRKELAARDQAVIDAALLESAAIAPCKAWRLPKGSCVAGRGPSDLAVLRAAPAPQRDPQVDRETYTVRHQAARHRAPAEFAGARCAAAGNTPSAAFLQITLQVAEEVYTKGVWILAGKSWEQKFHW